MSGLLTLRGMSRESLEGLLDRAQDLVSGPLPGAAILPVGVALTHGVRSLVFGVSLGVALFVYWTHRANISRLRRGEEPKLTLRRPAKEAGSADHLSQGRA